MTDKPFYDQDAVFHLLATIDRLRAELAECRRWLVEQEHHTDTARAELEYARQESRSLGQSVLDLRAELAQLNDAWTEADVPPRP